MMEDYEVGYGKPPKATRFKPERSGNPKGRPRGRRNKRSVIREVIDRKVTLRENGRTRRVSVFEALVESLVAKALKGSINDHIKLIQLIEKHAPEKLEKHAPEETRPDLSALTDEDLRGLRLGAARCAATGRRRTSSGVGWGPRRRFLGWQPPQRPQR